MNLSLMLAEIHQRKAELPSPEDCHCSSDAAELTHPALYHNSNSTSAIDFRVHRLPLAGLQVMDPRLVRIAPGACNECHRHAHESIFVVLAGHGELRLGEHTVALQAGDIACVPRWVVHQSRNISIRDELVLLAITDFGLTSTVLGDYDRRTRLKGGGADAFPVPGSSAAQEP